MATTNDVYSQGWDINLLRGISSGNISALPAGTTTDTLDAAQSLNDLIATPNDPSSFGSAEYNGNLEIGRDGNISSNVIGWNDGVGFFLGWSDTTYKFFIGDSTGDKLTWDGTTLSITGTFTATSGIIGGWTIGATSFSAVSGGNTTILSSGATAFSAGPTGSPTITMTQAGLVTATNIALSGTITVNGVALVGTGGDVLSGFHWSMFASGAGVPSYLAKGTGYSDATKKLMSFTIYDSANTKGSIESNEISNDLGSAFFTGLNVSAIFDGTAIACGLYITTHYWHSDSNATAGDRISKDGANVTISGTAPSAAAMLGHDPTNSYLLVMDSTTRIRRYSGISGTTITNINSDITLDTAVSLTAGFLYDNTNSRYICVDLTNNLIRRFNSSGTTIDTTAYTITDTDVKGVVLVGNRFYLAVMTKASTASTGNDYFSNSLIPTTMTR